MSAKREKSGMRRIILAGLAALALLVAAPITSREAQATPASPAALAGNADTTLVEKAHSARWHYIRRHYGPYGPYRYRGHYGRPHFYRHGYYRPRFHGRPHWRHRGWHRW